MIAVFTDVFPEQLPVLWLHFYVPLLASPGLVTFPPIFESPMGLDNAKLEAVGWKLSLCVFPESMWAPAPCAAHPCAWPGRIW